MIRILNFLCLAITGLACLGLYHVSEQTRVASVKLHNVRHEIVAERTSMSVLQAEWAKLADPSRIQRLAQRDFGVNGAPAIVLSSLELLPRRGQSAPLGGSDVRDASMTVSASHAGSNIRLAAVQPGN
jgi:cell division protein FtsL